MFFALKVLVVLVLLVVVAFAGLSIWSRLSPPNLGLADGGLRACPSSPNCVSSQAEQPGKRVPPLAYVGDRQATEAALRIATENLGLVSLTEEGDYWRHVGTSSVFRFLDDVEFVFDDTNAQVHVRSASRSGYSDRGVNATRVDSLRTAMSASGG